MEPGNTEQGKCRLTNEYPFFLFLIGHWYYEKNILYLKKLPILAGTHSYKIQKVACLRLQSLKYLVPKWFQYLILSCHSKCLEKIKICSKIKFQTLLFQPLKPNPLVSTSIFNARQF